MDLNGVGEVEDAEEHDTPQWKRDLILRIKSKRRLPSDDGRPQLLAGTPRRSPDAVDLAGQQPGLACSCDAVAVPAVLESTTSDCAARNGNVISSTFFRSAIMVQECTLLDHKHYAAFDSIDDILENGSDKSADSSSSEELRYGPGIVNKLKNRYLSLTLRENTTRSRPSILTLRKATSLEHLLEDDAPEPTGERLPPSGRAQRRGRTENRSAKNAASDRYRTAARVGDLKRARSVEAISAGVHESPTEAPVTGSLPSSEDVLISPEGNERIAEKPPDKSSPSEKTQSGDGGRVNRPKRIAPVMSEREKPPADVVKHAKRIFERSEPRARPPLRHTTGEVAAKVATYKNLIGQTRNSDKKPPIIKHKPVLPDAKIALKTAEPPPKLHLENGRSSPSRTDFFRSPPVSPSTPPLDRIIPDVSRITNGDVPHRPKLTLGLSQQTPDLILDSSPKKHRSLSPTFKILATDNFLRAEITESSKTQRDPFVPSPPAIRSPTTRSPTTFGPALDTSTPLADAKNKLKPRPPVVDNSVDPENALSDTTLNGLKPVAATHKTEKTPRTVPATKPAAFLPNVLGLSPQEIEKNKLNTAKNLEQAAVPPPIPFDKQAGAKLPAGKIDEESKKVQVPKAPASLKSKQSRDQNSIVFKFTDRKDVPDYVGNDGRIKTGKMEKPKVGEGGIIILPGVSLDESFLDDEEWKLSLEGPPSPCDITFTNDNILIDGRSSLNQKSKKSKMSIKFVESVPDIFEYPSEASLMNDFSPTLQDLSPNHTILGGTSLANYIPKVGPNEDFQLGITRSSPPVTIPCNTIENSPDKAFSAIEEPVLFSSGNNADILF